MNLSTKEFPAFQYLTAGDSSVRLNHRAMHGRVYRRNDPVWSTWWPPNGFNCRCRVSPVSQMEIEEDGTVIQQGPPIDIHTGRTVAPDSGFDSHPAQDHAAFREWMIRSVPGMERISRHLYDLPDWGSLPGRPAPPTTKSKNRKHFRKIFEGVFDVGADGVGRVDNVFGDEVQVTSAFWHHINQKEAMRRDRIKWVPEILVDPDEVWATIDDRCTESYLAKFVKPGGTEASSAVIVEVTDGALKAVTFIPTDKAERKRIGVLVHKR